MSEVSAIKISVDDLYLYLAFVSEGKQIELKVDEENALIILDYIVHFLDPEGVCSEEVEERDYSVKETDASIEGLYQ